MEARPWLGTLLVGSSAVAYSTAGFFTRLIELDVPTMLLWRGGYGGVFMLACIAVIERRRTWPAFRDMFRDMGLPGLGVAILSALATVCYLSALRLTTVAEVLAINATSPFISGALAFVIIGERERWPVVVASLVAMLGIVIMVGPGALAGHASGAALAFLMTLALAGMVVIMRAKKSVSMLPASCLSAFLSAAVVLPFAGTAIPTGASMIYLALFGIVQFGLGLILLTVGVRHVTALRVSLLSRLQSVLGPIWVWLGFGEVPGTSTLIGGALVLGSAFAAVLTGRRAR
jgi:drug/metabolite transporter (DMT)-like permease